MRQPWNENIYKTLVCLLFGSIDRSIDRERERYRSHLRNRSHNVSPSRFDTFPRYVYTIMHSPRIRSSLCTCVFFYACARVCMCVCARRVTFLHRSILMCVIKTSYIKADSNRHLALFRLCVQTISNSITYAPRAFFFFFFFLFLFLFFFFLDSPNVPASPPLTHIARQKCVPCRRIYLFDEVSRMVEFQSFVFFYLSDLCHSIMLDYFSLQQRGGRCLGGFVFFVIEMRIYLKYYFYDYFSINS